MFIRNLLEREKFVSGDGAALRELFNPLKDDLELRYSLAHATVKPGKTTAQHRLKVSEVYYILAGQGRMYIDDEGSYVEKDDVIYIPPKSRQRIKNTGREDLVFLCLVDPAWKKEYEKAVKD
jgi:mannose-6-phosphate isomerase-like protein (cupin superfamily)